MRGTIRLLGSGVCAVVLVSASAAATKRPTTPRLYSLTVHSDRPLSEAETPASVCLAARAYTYRDSVEDERQNESNGSFSIKSRGGAGSIAEHRKDYFSKDGILRSWTDMLSEPEVSKGGDSDEAIIRVDPSKFKVSLEIRAESAGQCPADMAPGQARMADGHMESATVAEAMTLLIWAPIRRNVQ